MYLFELIAVYSEYVYTNFFQSMFIAGKTITVLLMEREGIPEIAYGNVLVFICFVELLLFCFIAYLFYKVMKFIVGVFL